MGKAVWEAAPIVVDALADILIVVMGAPANLTANAGRILYEFFDSIYEKGEVR